MMSFKFGTSNLCQVRHKISPTVLLPWQCYHLLPGEFQVGFTLPVNHSLLTYDGIWASHVFQAGPSVTPHVVKNGDICFLPRQWQHHSAHHPFFMFI